MASCTSPEFIAQVLPLYSPPIRRKRTREEVDRALREFAPSCPTTEAIAAAAVAARPAAHAGRSPIASSSVLRAFAAAVRTGHAELGIVPRDPSRGRPPRRWRPDGDLDPPDRVRHLSAEPARRPLDRVDREALEAADRPDRWHAPRLATPIRLYLFAGLRESEALGLRVEDLDPAAGVIEVRPNPRRPLKTRAGRRRVPVPPPLRAAPRPRPAEVGSEWLFPGAARRGPRTGGPPGGEPLDRVAAAGRRAGIEAPVAIPMLRHTFAAIGERPGFGESPMQRLLGRRQRRTRLHYRHEDGQAIREAGATSRL